MMRRYLIYFSVTFSIILLPITFLSFFFDPIDGDLTRIGGYAENDFGWNSPQPVVKINANGKSITNPDILVLGDSFSAENVWQSVLNKKILSFQYSQVGCISNWIEYARNKSSAKLVVIESVERAFIERFRELPSCKSNNPIVPFEMLPTTTSARRATRPSEFHVRQTLLVAINTLKMDFENHASVRGDVINAPINSGCAKFSNRRADRILYYPNDEQKLHWSSKDQSRAILNVMHIQMTFSEQGKKFVLIIVPDKLSVYQDCLLDDTYLGARKQVNIINSLIESGVNTPDLLRAFKENSNKIVDLYAPNNTHLSTSGYVLMAEQLRYYGVEGASSRNGKIAR